MVLSLIMKREIKRKTFWRVVESMCFNIDKNLNVFCRPKSLAATACHYAFFLKHYGRS